MNTKQQLRALAYMQVYGSITPLEAMNELGIYRLSDVIFKLRDRYEIKTERVTTLNRYEEKISYGKYVLIGV